MRWREWVPQVRRALALLRGHLTLRRIARYGLLGGLATAAALVAEALARSQLPSPYQRMPTALYSRPTPWGEEDDLGPLPLTTLDGRPLELRLPVPLAQVPQHLVQAVLAVEDQRFFSHHGLDLRRAGGALVANIRAGGIAQGGSTITQQLARSLYLSNRRSVLRKLRESAIAVALDARFGKTAILEAYLNEIYLGQDRGQPLHGVGAAARYYFGKDVSRLTVAESALLAGMIQAPNRYAPTRNPSAARERRDVVLRLLVEQGRLPAAEGERARQPRLPGRVFPAPAVEARWLRDLVLADQRGRWPERGLAIYTTLDFRLQRVAERALRQGLDRIRSTAPGAEGALVALDPRTGDLLALVGGRDYGASQFNRATQALRQPGSAFKPIVALAALEPRSGRSPAFTLASLVDDSPLEVSTPAGLWRPANYDGRFRGPVTLRAAMEQSLNVPVARVGLAVGPARIVDVARRLGITSPIRAVPSVALGSSELTLLELVRAYGVFAASGGFAPTRVILGHSPAGTPAIAPDPPQPAQVTDPAVAFLVTSTLQGVVQRGTARSLTTRARLAGIAGKTGTSNDWRDAWFVAYTPTLAVGAWVGYDDGRSVRLAGASAALPIVADFLQHAAPRGGWDPFEIPEGVVQAALPSGDEGWPWLCGQQEFFLQGTEPAGLPCFRFELPEWWELRRWGENLEQRAARIVERILAGSFDPRRRIQ
jgi:penicillin-binding protein 1B